MRPEIRPEPRSEPSPAALPPSRPPFRLGVPIQVRFRDTDAMGHVNNAVYLTYLEVARTAYWQRLFAIASYNEVDFILARAEVDFVAPVFVHSQATVWIRVSEIGRKSFRFAYELVADGGLALRGETVQVMYDYARAASKPLAAAQRDAILDFEEPGTVVVRG
jgi:acyl-CoA thioester hydrolase